MKIEYETYHESKLYAAVIFDVKGFEGCNQSKKYYFKFFVNTGVLIDGYVLVHTALGLNIGHVVGFIDSENAAFDPTETIICGLSRNMVSSYAKSKRLKESSRRINNAYQRFSRVVTEEIDEVSDGVCSVCPLRKVCDTIQEATDGTYACQLLDKDREG